MVSYSCPKSPCREEEVEGLAIWSSLLWQRASMESGNRRGPPAAPLRPLLSPDKPWSVRSVGHYTCTSLRSSLSITESVYKEGTGASCLSLAMVTCSALVRQAAHWLSLMQRVLQFFWNWSLLSQKAHQGPSERNLFIRVCLWFAVFLLQLLLVFATSVCPRQTTQPPGPHEHCLCELCQYSLDFSLLSRTFIRVWVFTRGHCRFYYM